MTRTHANAATVDVLIIGTGFSGLAAAIQLLQSGVDDLVLLERGDDVGGTWRENTYPGCGCDVPSPLYSFSFAPKADWSRMFARQPEIYQYLRDCADTFGVRDKIRFHREVTGAHWDADTARWEVTTRLGERWSARVLVSGIGGFSQPSIPNIQGAESFSGNAFHTARWQHDVDLAGQRVAVVGTGASSIQVVPEIAKSAGEVKLFQRTPPWIVPKGDRAFSRAEKALYRVAPKVQRALRGAIYAQHEARAVGFTINPRLLVLGERIARRHLRKQIPDKALRNQLTPDYAFGCKRVLISNNYYPAVCQDHVDLVTASIDAINAKGIRTADGQQHDVDVIVWGTGFATQRPFERGFLVGRDGVDLWDAWENGLSAYKGTCIHGFPNFFMISGPNTGLGHNSMVYMIESQVNLIVDAVNQMRQHGWHSIDVHEWAQADWQAAVERASRRSVWTEGCQSWYLDKHGRNTTLWPGFTFDFREETRRLTEADFCMTLSGDLASQAPGNGESQREPMPSKYKTLAGVKEAARVARATTALAARLIPARISA